MRTKWGPKWASNIEKWGPLAIKIAKRGRFFISVFFTDCKGILMYCGPNADKFGQLKTKNEAL